MQTYRLAFIGFGNVGQGLTQILQERGKILAEQFGIKFLITDVCDLQKGTVTAYRGIDPGRLLSSVKDNGNLAGIEAEHPGWDTLQTIDNSQADILVEMSYTNLSDGEPATTHVQRALESGKHVVTTNKGPVALHYHRLLQIAADNGVELGVEGTVMSGTPALHLGSEFLSAAGIQKIEGIFNGTTNYILTEMGKGSTYEQALSRAQELGYAEADPTGDVEGFDTAGKVVILANLLMNVPLSMAAVERQGITRISVNDIESARLREETWKLIGSLSKTPQGVTAVVSPRAISNSHPLAGVSGATNAITYSTDLLGDVTLIGPGAGRLETGYALLTDMLAIHRKMMG